MIQTTNPSRVLAVAAVLMLLGAAGCTSLAGGTGGSGSSTTCDNCASSPCARDSGDADAGKSRGHRPRSPGRFRAGSASLPSGHLNPCTH